MDAEPKKSKSTGGEKRKRKSTTKKDDKKSRGKQRKKDDSTENKTEEQQPTQEKEGGSPTRPSSPENCSICLGDLQNKSFTDSCFHMFCFVCLREWSKVKAECPLCKQKFKNIIYNVNSYEKYDKYNIEEQNSRNLQSELDERRFRYRTTVTFERRFMIHEHDYTQPIARPTNRPTNVTTRSNWRRFREPATSDFRRRVYQNGMRATNVHDRRLRTRDTTPQFFSRNSAQLHRLVPWLNRELNALFQNQPDHVTRLMGIVLETIKRYPIDSEEFYQGIYPYVGRNTRHFMHEFLSFAKSPYNMPTYDMHVNYQEENHTDNTISTDDTDDDFDNEIIDIEQEGDAHRSPPVRRAGVQPISNLPGWSSLLRGYNDFFDTSVGTRMRMPLSLSGWDSPTPGPSWDLGGLDYPGSTYSADNVPVESNRASSPIDIATSSDSDSDSTDSAESTNSDIVFVKMDKPWQERSPIMLSSDGSDVERNIGLDFQHKHYSLKKTHLKKKKSKEHKKHSRENSNERSKHKKHKRHKTSDKSTEDREALSKSSDSFSYHSSSTSQRANIGKPSSSKHKDGKRSSFKSRDRDSSSMERHHKKHKKHKKGEEEKSSASSVKLKSVIVKPYSSVNSNEMSSSKSSANSVQSKSSSTISSNTCTSKSNGKDYPYKKHPSGHKRSGKLTDIVPKLIGKKLIQFSSSKMSKEKTATSTSDFLKSSIVSMATTQGSLEKECKLLDTATNEPFQSSNLAKDSERDDVSLSNNLSGNSLQNKPDNILSLDNSRRCMKCNLLYIPELLDHNGICFTCKRKHACETATRSFSDAFLDLHLLSEQSSSNTPFNYYTDNLNSDNESTTAKIDNRILTTTSNTENQIDLSSDIDSSVDVCESDSDGCQIITSKNISRSQDRDLLGINFSNPSSPVKSKNSFATYGTTAVESPLSWNLGVTHSPALATDEWQGILVPRPQIDYSPRSPVLTQPSVLDDRFSCSSSMANLSTNNSSLNPILPRDTDEKEEKLFVDDLSNASSFDGSELDLAKNQNELISNDKSMQNIDKTVKNHNPINKGNSLLKVNNFHPEIESNLTSVNLEQNDVNVTSLSSDEGSFVDIENYSDDCEITHYTENLDSADKQSHTPNSMLNKNLGAEEEVISGSDEVNLESEEAQQLSQEAGVKDPLRIDFSNPSTPITGFELGMSPNSVMDSQSPVPWTLDVSNPPTPSSDHWPGYMAPKILMNNSSTSPLVYDENQTGYSDEEDISDNESISDEEMTVDKSIMPTLNKMNTEQGKLIEEKEKEKETSEADLTDSEDECEETRQLPSTLGEKLEGLTDFPSDVLQEMKKGNRLTLHNILSQANTSQAGRNSEECLTSSVNPQNSLLCMDDLVTTVSNDTHVTDSHMDCLMGIMDEGNSNCCNEIEIDNSVSSLGQNEHVTDKAPDFANLSSPMTVSMETDITNNCGNGCYSSDQQTNIAVTSFPSEESDEGLNFVSSGCTMNSSEIKTDTAINSGINEADDLDDDSIIGRKDLDSDSGRLGEGISSMANQLVVSDGHPHRDNVIETSNYSTDSDNSLQDETIASNVHSETSVEYRVDILHSNQELTNIFENDESIYSDEF